MDVRLAASQLVGFQTQQPFLKAFLIARLDLAGCFFLEVFKLLQAQLVDFPQRPTKPPRHIGTGFAQRTDVFLARSLFRRLLPVRSEKWPATYSSLQYPTRPNLPALAR